MKQFFMLLKVLKHISYLYKEKKNNNRAYLIMIATRNATHYSPCPLGPFRKIIKNYL